MSWRSAVWTAAVILTMSGCGINPVKMHPPSFGGPATVRVVIEFSDVLNLPMGAEVTYEGSEVGSVRAVYVDKSAVAVTVSLDRTSQIPSGSTAAIVQDTVLGDSYISLSRPPGTDASSPLIDGDRIPLSRTRPPTSVEDMMTTLATFLGTGSIQRVQGVLRRVNLSMPQSVGETENAAATLAKDLRNLADHTGDLDQSIDHLGRLASVLKRNADVVDDLTTVNSLDFWTKYLDGIGSVITLLTRLGGIMANGAWLIPMLDSVSTALEQTGEIGGGASQAAFNNQTLLPFLTDPRVQITEVVTPDGTDRTTDARNVLARLGAAR